DSPSNNSITTSFTLSILGEAPTITAIADQTVAKDGTSGPITFTVGDKETFPGFLTVTVDSSNKTFVPNAKVVLGGSGSNRTVTVSPATGQEGTTTITVTVKDTEGQTGTRAFVFATAIPQNDAPTITAISNQTTTPGQSTAQISFTVADKETAASLLLVTSSSSNKTLVPDANVFLGGTGATRTVLVTTAAAQEGTTTITLTITDGGPGVAKSASTSFTVTSTAVVNLAPTLSSVSAQTTDKNTASTAASFTVGDTETAVASLTVAGVSSNTTLVPNANIAISGTGAARTVVVTPANNQVGTATITLTVVDGGSKTASTSFTLTVNQTAPTKGDFDADGKSDILFQDNDGYLAVWAMNGITLKSANFLTPSNIGDTNYRIAGTGDFNRDGQEDILFQHKDGTLAVWYMNGSTQTGAEVLNPSNPGDKNWQVAGVADIDKDGNADLVFQHTDGTLAVWYMNGINLTSAALPTPSTPGDKNWRVVGLGDFNADGKQDIAFQHTDGTLAVWYMNGAALTQATLTSPSNPGDSKWRVIGVADRNGDGKVDLLFQHTDYSVAVWNMNGITLTSAQLLSPSNSGATWKAAGPK
ncbi:MAG: VCBS repeat-containing protein, partial [Pedosphaera sp.]|nr:VCBS repeat-containing protein [Pedosphaera sp.]